MRKPIIHSLSGATVGLYPMEEVEAVTIIARFHAGSWYEGEKWGAHHLLEHVMLDGSDTFPDEDAIELFKEENGLTTNGSTGGRSLEFWVRTPRTKVTEAVQLLFDTVFRPTLPEKDIVREKTIISQEYRDKWSNPQTRFGKACAQNLYGESHPYMRDGMGDISYVTNVTREELLKIHQKFCVKNNLTLVAVGNFEQSSLLTLIQKELADVPSGSLQECTIPPTNTALPYFFRTEDMLKITIGIDWVSQILNDTIPMKDRIASNLATYVLGGSSRSRLNKELRTKRGWVYSASAGRTLLPTRSGLWVHTSTEPEKIKEVYDILLSLPKELARKGMSDEEFLRAKNFINMQRLISFDSVDSIAEKIMSDLFFDHQVNMPEEQIEISNTIQKSEVTAFLREYLQNPPVVSVMAKEDPHLL